MAFSPDVLTTALQELMPGFSETFTKFHPAFDAIIMKGNKRQAQGPYIQFALVPDGPGFLTQIVSGNEVIAGGRKQNAIRATEFAATMIYAYDVPGQDLREANNKMDLVEILLSLSDVTQSALLQSSTSLSLVSLLWATLPTLITSLHGTAMPSMTLRV